MAFYRRLHESLQPKEFSFKDLLPQLDTAPHIYYKDWVHEYKRVLKTGEVASTDPAFVRKLFVDGTRSGYEQPYCGGLFGYWKNTVEDLAQHPITYSHLPLYTVSFPGHQNEAPTQKILSDYFYPRNGLPENSFPNDILLRPQKYEGVVMFKSEGFPSGLVRIKGKIHLVSTPLKGLDGNGELLFLDIAKDHGKPEVAPTDIGILGQELTFQEPVLTLLNALFDAGEK